MSTEVQDPIQNHVAPSATSLVGDIIGDVQKLIKQQFLLTRREIKDELFQCKEAALIFGLGVAGLFLGGGAMCLALAHLLHWGTSPPDTDVARFPLWACHAVVGALFIGIGGVLAYVGRMLFKSIKPMKNPATKALKENIAWATAPK